MDADVVSAGVTAVVVAAVFVKRARPDLAWASVVRWAAAAIVAWLLLAVIVLAVA